MEPKRPFSIKKPPADDNEFLQEFAGFKIGFGENASKTVEQVYQEDCYRKKKYLKWIKDSPDFTKKHFRKCVIRYLALRQGAYPSDSLIQSQTQSTDIKRSDAFGSNFSVSTQNKLEVSKNESNTDANQRRISDIEIEMLQEADLYQQMVDTYSRLHRLTLQKIRKLQLSREA